MNTKTLADLRKPSHPAAAIVGAFQQMRDDCKHYHGIQDDDDGVQCSHKSHPDSGTWCAMHHCPLIKERAVAEGVGE